ncbi:MAG: hypothetical protein QOG56_1326, partial [Solirubrobacteraceae bacterium]|nr:hypothetical protein [Solirubrobacteraceae bacterium]
MAVNPSSSGPGRTARLTRTAIVAVALLASILATAPAAGAVTLEGARAKALRATKAERAHEGVILFGLRVPIRARASIRQAGRRPAPAGSSRRVMPAVLRAGSEPAFFFYLDRGAYQASQHAGRVVLVGVHSGKVRRSRTISFSPAIDGRLPAFLRSRAGYESARYRVAASDYAVPGATARAVRAGLGSLGAATSRSVASDAVVAAHLAAEHSCMVAIGGRPSQSVRQLGSASGSPILPLLRFDSAGRTSLRSFVTSEAIARRGCRDILLAISGDGYRSLPTPTVRTRLAPSGRRMGEYHVSAAMLRALIGANPSVTFKLVIDAPGSGGFVESLKSLSNVLVISTSSGSAETAYRYLPSKRIGGVLTANPLRMRADSSLVTTLLFGGAAFAASDAEVGHAAAEVAAGRAPSFLAYVLARAFALSRPVDFTADLGATQRLYVHGFTPTAPGPGGPSDAAPVATPQTVTTVEDTAAAITLAGSDPDGDPLTFAIAAAPAHGVLGGTAPNLTYTPVADYEGPDAFTFTVSDGSLISATATVSITVSAVDDPPLTSAGGTLAYVEDGPPVAIAPSATVADGDSPSLAGATVQITAGLQAGADVLGLPSQPAITSSYDAPTGTLTLSGTATVAAYQAALRAVTYVNTSDDPSASDRTVSFRARDAGGFGPASTHTITVQPVNDPPAIATSAGPVSYTEGDPAIALDAGLVLSDPDSQITGATVQITNNHAIPQDVLALASPPAGIAAAYDSAAGRLTLSGTATVAAYQAALRAVTYRNSSSNPTTSARTVTFLASDASSTSAPATRGLTVNSTDNAPDVANSPGSLVYLENFPAMAIDTAIAITDLDSANLTGATVQITTGYVAGEDVLALTPPAGITVAPFDGALGRLTLSGTATVATYEQALEAVTYRNTSDDPSTAPRTVTYQARDAGGFGSAGTHGITVTALDDDPVAVDDAATVAEDSAANAIDVRANDTDVDAGPKNVASASDPAHGTVVVTAGALSYQPDPNYCNSDGGSPDAFTYVLDGGSTATVGVTVTCSDDPPVAVDDSATVPEDAAPVPVAVLANDTDVDLGPKTISSASDPAHGTVVLTGGSPGAYTGLTYEPDPNYCNTPPPADTFTYTINGGTSATVSMTVTCVDDPPTAVDDSATLLEDAAPTPISVLANDTDVDLGTKTISSASDPANGTVVLTGGAPGAHTGLTYQPDPNYCNAPPPPDTFTYTLNGGSVATVSMTVTCVNDAPVADDETLSGSQAAIGNTTLVVDDPSDGPPAVAGPKKTITGDVLAGDVDVDGPGPLVVTAGTFATNDGGTVVVESDGDFTFTPAAGTSCSDANDFFDYTVSDQSTPTAGTDVGRVNIVIAGCVWYVDNNAAGNGGTSTAPFDTLAQAESASAANQTIFVFDGDDTSSGYGTGIDLKPNQRLLGEASDLVVGADVLHAGIPAKRPTLTDNGADVVALASGNSVRGIDVDPQGTGGGIAGAAGDAGGVIDDVRIVDTGAAGTQPSLELDTTTGTFDISNLTIDNSAATGTTSGSIGVRLANAGTVNFASAGTISITTAGAKALDVSGPTTSLGAGSVLDAVTVTGSGSGGVSMTGTTGTTTFSNLALTTTSGASAAFLLANAGSVTVAAAGTADVHATGGPAVDVSATSGATLAFDDVDSTSSAGAGVSISGLGGGTFGANASSLISNAGGIDFDLDGGTGAVTYDGAITDNGGQLVRVQNTSGATKDFNGPIGAVSGALGNVGLSNNGGATIRFDGGLTLASNGATAALSATGGGTLAVTDPAGAASNKLGTTTSTGQALNVVNTTISDDDLTFESVRSSGASNGIVLDNTANANGRLLVTGAGAACSSAANCSGGAIQGSTGAGIALTSVPGGAGLTRMAVTSGGDDGIRATTVNDLDLADSIVTNNGNSHTGGAEERGLDYLNVTGTPQILRTTVSGSDDSNAHIRNTVAGTTALAVDQSTFSNSKFNTGLRLRGEGPSVMNATVTGSVFSLNADPGFSMQTDSVNTAQQTLLFDNNDVSGGSSNAVSGRPEVSINVDGASTVKATVTNNDIKSAAGAEVILNTLANHTGTFDAKVNGNHIGDSQPGALDALADGGSAIWGWAHGDGISRME